MAFDLLLKGGHLIDPRNRIDQAMDLGIAQDKVAAVGVGLPSEQARQVVDVSGMYVVPGLVDIHVHLYGTPGHRHAWAGDYSVLPDGFSFRSGVTTMVDTGTAGWRNFEDFRFRVLDRCQTRAFALLNIVGMGMVTTDIEQNPYDMNVDQALAAIREHEDLIVGVKTAHYYGPEWISIDRALAAGERAALPVMVDGGHFRKERPYYQLVTERLRPGDITTHIYHAAVPWLDGQGKILRYLYQARERGVVFDVGHGAGSLVFRNAVPSIAQGFLPDSISTDLHVLSMNGPLMDMANLMSKFLVMGMSLPDIVKASTTNPAEEIGHPELGHLGVGAVADVAVLNRVQGRFGYLDVHDGRLEGTERLLCGLTLKDGRIVWDLNGRGGIDYRNMGPTYGLPNADQLIVPAPS